ncbi:hypothetical protein RHECNPAF_6420094 [Rhizobium etli CNPAF512]|nr:hypothetical protein RHECNPAF_6420094 [Rhizobium etli CNPAF512]
MMATTRRLATSACSVRSNRLSGCSRSSDRGRFKSVSDPSDLRSATGTGPVFPAGPSLQRFYSHFRGSVFDRHAGRPNRHVAYRTSASR